MPPLTSAAGDAEEEDDESTTAGSVNAESVDDTFTGLREATSPTSMQTSIPVRNDLQWNDDFLYDSNEIACMNNQLQPRLLDSENRRRPSCFCCCSKTHESQSDKFRLNVRRTVHLLNISPRQKSLILDRYVSLVEQYSKTKKRYSCLYGSTRCVTTLCGILTPALVSIQPFFGSDTWANPMYWTTFSTSFTLALINGYIALFKIDKKFNSSTKAYLDLETAGWEYFSLVGRYAAENENEPRPTHANRFLQFMTRVEEIRKGESKVEYGGGSGEDHQ